MKREKKKLELTPIEQLMGVIYSIPSIIGAILMLASFIYEEKADETSNLLRR